MILSLETSTTVCTVALHDEANLIGHQTYFLQKSHSSLLPGIIDQLLSNCSINKGDLKAVAVSGGPGSYTGLRIGVTTSKALCFGLGIPLISIPTLNILLEKAFKSIGEEAYVVSMLDARRMEVYALVADETRRIIRPTHPLIIEDGVFDWIEYPRVYLIGNGAQKCEGKFDPSRFVINGNWYPDAKYMGQLAYEAFSQNSFEDLRFFEPDYLKEYQTKKPKNRLLTNN